ncbi:MAG: SprT-like domain-containing protein [Oscillospiraceae bacterium]|jgi:hypothetical protein|nr:SprT-like domain-containing protein [Oscillospiraceae bacterium]
MIEISTVVKKTEELFDLFNEHFYEGALTRPAITVSPDGGRGAYGWCSVYEIWTNGDEAHREINLCAEYLNRPMAEVCATLLHEMAHLHNLIHGIADVSNNGYYHNLKFKETGEAHGLHIEKHEKYGWTVTTLTEETAAWLDATLGGDEFKVSRQPEGGTGGKTAGRKSKNRSIKYVCPECGTIIRATREVSVICGDCGVAFERE